MATTAYGNGEVIGSAWEGRSCGSGAVELKNFYGSGNKAIGKGSFGAVQTKKDASLKALLDCSDAGTPVRAGQCGTIPGGHPIQCVVTTL